MSNLLVKSALKLIKTVSPKAKKILDDNPQLVDKAVGMMGKYSMDRQGVMDAIADVKSQGNFETGKRLLERVPMAKGILASMGLADIVYDDPKTLQTNNYASSFSSLKGRLDKLK